jgi:FAD/FMN-containing dehydrogenase
MHGTMLAGASRLGISIPRLHGSFNGSVIAPGDPGYDQARAVFFGGFEALRPVAIIAPADTAEVARVVSLARDSGLELAVRSGGHSSAGHGTADGGIVLDLANLKGLEIDLRQRTAWAGAGLTAGEYTAATGAHGLATGFGDTGSVGIGGITLGGGIGYLVRKHGLTIDSLLAAEMVTADGSVLRLDAQSHPELFWAIRGGGGNFGVATRFRFRLHPLETIVGGMLLLPATAEVIAGVIAEAEAAPEELSAIVNVMPAPPLPFLAREQVGELVVMARMVYAGPAEAAQPVLDRFRALATPIADTLQPMPYSGMFPPREGGFHPTAVAHTMFVDRVDHQVAATILRHLEASDALMRSAELRVLGGAMARVPVQATAFAHRHSRIMVNLAAFYDRPADRAARQAWIDRFAAALQQDDQGAYVNFLGDEGPARVRQAYPTPTWERLAAIKRRWDPTNLFRRNHNIPPATTEMTVPSRRSRRGGTEA